MMYFCPFMRTAQTFLNSGAGSEMEANYVTLSNIQCHLSMSLIFLAKFGNVI